MLDITRLSVEKVFEQLVKANLTLNLAKCEFGKATVTSAEREFRASKHASKMLIMLATC